MWGTLTAHTPGTYEKAEANGGYGIDLTTYSGDKYEVYYFSANSKFGNNITADADKLTFRLMAADTDSEYILFGSKQNHVDDKNGGLPYNESCDWIETNFATTGFAKSDYTYGETTFNEFFAVTPNGGNSGYTKTCWIKPKAGDSFTLKVSGYTEFAILGKDNSSTKYVKVSVDGGDNVLPKSSVDSESKPVLERRAVSLTTGEHTIVVSIEGSSACNIYGFSLKLPAAGNTLEYNANGGSGTMENTVGTGTQTLRTNTYTKSGCSFQGWATSQANANAGTVTYVDGATNYNLSADATLYAVWKLNAPTISCEDNVVTMTVPGSSTVYYTTDGSTEPTSSSIPYDPSNKPVIAATTTFKAIAILANHVSSNITTQECVYAAALSDVAAPTGLSSTAQTATSLTFGWNTAEHASSYDVYLYSDEGCLSLATTTESNPQNVNTTSATFNGLTVSTTYYCKVQSKGDGTSYKVNGGITPTAASAETPCSAITPTWSYPFSKVSVGITLQPEIGKDGSDGDVSYASSATDYIDNNCYAKAAGSATITATVAASGNYCAGNITSGTITVVADDGITGIVKQSLNTGNDVAWGTPSIATTDETNITSTTAISATELSISGNGNNNNGGQTAKITGTTSTTFDDTKYLSLGFTVKAGKQLNVSAIYIPVQPVGADRNNFKAVLSDSDPSTDDIEGTINNIPNGKLSYIKFPAYGVVRGNVTLKIYAWNWTNSKDGLRLGKSIVIDGTIEDAPAAPTYTVTYMPGEGSGPEYIIDDAAMTVAGCPSAFIAPSGKVFNGWKDALNNDVAVGAAVTSNLTLTAQWSEVVCPIAGSGDVVFSWTPKSGTVSAEYIAAGGRNLAPYMESVVGGSMTGYAQDIDAETTTLYKNSNNHVYFNGNSAYIKVNLCELAEGDKLLVTGQANNMWVSTSADRPADAASAAAVLVPGEAFYILGASALIGKSTIYIFREADFTEVASLTITRPQKFTATYAAPDLTDGDVPAAVSNIFDGQKITLADQGTMVKGDLVFHGWNDGTQTYAAGADYTVGANVTLTAVWKQACPVSGVIYSLAMKTGLANQDIAHGQNLPLTSEYATITGGEATLRNNDGSGDDKAKIYNSEIYFNGANAYVKVDMDCGPLAIGDEIVITSNNAQNELYLTNTNNTSAKIETEGRSYTIVANDLLEGKSIFYIWRKSGGTAVGTITITRPAPDASVPTIDASTPADASYAAADPISAMTVTADAVAPKDLHYQWYKENGETDIEVGTDAASYTPTASGEYYCVVTNSPSGYTPKSATSRKATITMISSDATLAWLKADGNDITLSDGVYAYEYVIADNATVAPTITAGKNEEHAEVTITQADSKTGTATIHVVAQDGSTYHDYTVKFNEFSGCLTAFYFPYATDAENNHVTNNEALRGHTVFTTTQTNSSSYAGTLTVGSDEYPATKSTGSAADFGNLVVPAKYTATLYLLFRTGGSNCSVQLAKAGETPTPYMTSDAYASQGIYQYNFENVQAGTYVIRVVKSNGDVQNSQYIAMAAELCRYEVSSVSLANTTLRTGHTATPEMTITPVKGAITSQAWSFVEAATAEAAGLSINATTGAVTAAAAATPGNYTVKVVLNGDNTLSATCTVHVITEYSQVDVTGTTEWDFATGKAASSKITIGYGDTLLANVDGVTNDDTFNSQALMVDANYVSNSQLQSKSVMFHTTVPGLLTVRYACTSDKSGVNRVLYINDRATTSQTDNAEVTYTQVVPAGDVTIKAMYDNSGTPTVDIMNYKYIKFDANLLPTDAEESTLGGYERDVTNGYYGTICLKKAGVMTGASIFEVAYMTYENTQPYKVFFDEVLNGTMEAGKPYIFLPNEGSSKIGVYYTGTAEETTAGSHNGLHGTFVHMDGSEIYGKYIFYQNTIFMSENLQNWLDEYRAYIVLSEVSGHAVAPLPGRRRVSMGVQAPQVATGIDNAEATDAPRKMMINGELFILRGEKMYDATGRLVK